VKKATQTGRGEYASASPTGSPLSSQSQLFHAFLLVSLVAAHTQYPAHRRCFAADDVLAQTGGHISVV